MENNENRPVSIPTSRLCNFLIEPVNIRSTSIELRAAKPFAFVDDPGLWPESESVTLSGGQYCVVCRDLCHDEQSTNLSDRQVNLLLNYLEKEKYECDGPFI